MPEILTIIPSRMNAKRLPGKPLLKIQGISIINHVYRRALEADIGEVYVATEDQEIFDSVTNNGGKCIITGKHHKTGTDRIFEAFTMLKDKNADYILNLQGDEPLINPNDVKKFSKKIIESRLDMGTLASKIELDSKYKDENIVKIKTEKELNFDNISLAIDFFRKKESYEKANIYHHIGIYLYKTNVLKKIVSLKQTEKEKKLRLEQLRALENNVKIYSALAKFSPIGIDTKEDYEKVKNLLETKNI